MALQYAADFDVIEANTSVAADAHALAQVVAAWADIEDPWEGARARGAGN